MANLKDADLNETMSCRYGTMSLFKNDNIVSRSLREYGEWAQAEIEFLCGLIRPGQTVLDIGSFIGTHALAFAASVGANGRVYAFEPQLAFFKVLKTNIEQNNLANVTALNAAVSDQVGQVEICQGDISHTHNFGTASIGGLRSRVSESVLRDTIEVTTIDQLALNRCDLIKIDAEDMETSVLKGALETLRSKRPIVFAECNSLEYGWRVVELLSGDAYQSYLLIAPSYNPRNFRRNPNNFVGAACEAGLVLIPTERLHQVQGSLGSASDPALVPISCIDDLALALLKKPQYKHEVMSQTKAAGALGVGFWANEVELGQLQETIRQQQTGIQELRGAVAERDEQMLSLLNSASWRMTRPVRAAKNWVFKAGRAVSRLLVFGRGGFKSGVRATRSSGLVYSVDSFKINRRHVFARGWMFHPKLKISSVKLIVRAGSASSIYDVSYGQRREDVAQLHPFGNAQNSGLLISVALPSPDITGTSLQVEFHGEASEPVQIDLTPEPVEADGSSIAIDDLLALLDAKQLPLSNPNSGKGCPGGISRAAVQGFLETVEESLLSDRKCTMVIDHNFGGGANRYRNMLLEDFRKADHPALLVYYDLSRAEYIIELIDRRSDLRVKLDAPADLLSLAKRIGLGEIVLNNLYGFVDPLKMVTLLTALKKESGATLTVAVHDFLSVCPSLHLLDETGKFCGIPDLSRCEQCLPANKGDFALSIGHKDIRSWRNAWREFLSEASLINCFSESSAQLVRSAYPELDPHKCVVRPHVVDYLRVRKPTINLSGPLNIGVVGAINVCKGANVIRDLARSIKGRGLPATITVIGTVQGVALDDSVTVTGPYELQDLPRLMEKHGANIFLLPSIVPETFSYVSEELMRLDVPLAVFSLGAPPERVAKYAKGLVLQGMDAGETLDALIAFQARLRRQFPDVTAETEFEGRGSVQVHENPPALHAFTCAAVNYLPKVRQLCKSIKQHHPEMQVHLALADRVPEWLSLSKEPFDDLVSLESLKIPNKAGWIFQHNVVELSTGIKPFMLQKLLDLPNCQQVYYFDPDIVLFSRLDDLISTLNANSVVLTPHVTQPESTIEAICDNEICSMKHGIYNLGFIGVRNVEQGRLFAKWWSERIYHFCQAETELGLFTDQKWIDFAPVFFEGVHIVKSPRFNVAPWNLSTRKLAGGFDSGFTVNGEPLAFYHFTGFDSGAHKVVAMKYAADNPAVAALIHWYEQRHENDADRRAANTPWAYSTFSSGEPITQLHRSLYRLRKDLQDKYPNPFEIGPGKNSYYQWFRKRASIEYPQAALFTSGTRSAVAK